MIIECRARRKARDPRVGRKDNDGGTKVKLYGKIYWFRPQPELVPTGCDPAAHVCRVDDERAVKHLLEQIPEQFNEIGKPPRVPQKAGPRVAVGQPPVRTELLDDDDSLGERDSREVDPLASARRIQQEWINDMLERPVRQVAKDLDTLNEQEITLLIEAEKDGKNRKSMLEVLTVSREHARDDAAVADMTKSAPDSEDDDIQVE